MRAPCVLQKVRVAVAQAAVLAAPRRYLLLSAEELTSMATDGAAVRAVIALIESGRDKEAGEWSTVFYSEERVGFSKWGVKFP